MTNISDTKCGDEVMEFLGVIARMKTDEEYDDEGESMLGDDAAMTLSEIIEVARRLKSKMENEATFRK